MPNKPIVSIQWFRNPLSVKLYCLSIFHSNLFSSYKSVHFLIFSSLNTTDNFHNASPRWISAFCCRNRQKREAFLLLRTTPSEVLGDKNTFFGESRYIGTTKSRLQTRTFTRLVWRTNTIIPTEKLLSCCYQINGKMCPKVSIHPRHQQRIGFPFSFALAKWPRLPASALSSPNSTHTHTHALLKLFQQRFHRHPLPFFAGWCRAVKEV